MDRVYHRQDKTHVVLLLRRKKVPDLILQKCEQTPNILFYDAGPAMTGIKKTVVKE